MKNKNIQFLVGAGIAALVGVAGYFIYIKLIRKEKYWKVLNSKNVPVLVRQRDVEIDDKGTAYFKKDGWVYNLDKTKGYEKKKDDWGGGKAEEFIE